MPALVLRPVAPRSAGRRAGQAVWTVRSGPGPQRSTARPGRSGPIAAASGASTTSEESAGSATRRHMRMATLARSWASTTPAGRCVASTRWMPSDRPCAASRMSRGTTSGRSSVSARSSSTTTTSRGGACVRERSSSRSATACAASRRSRRRSSAANPSSARPASTGSRSVTSPTTCGRDRHRPRPAPPLKSISTRPSSDGGWRRARLSTRAWSSSDLPAPVVPATSMCGPSAMRSRSTAAGPPGREVPRSPGAPVPMPMRATRPAWRGGSSPVPELQLRRTDAASSGRPRSARPTSVGSTARPPVSPRFRVAARAATRRACSSIHPARGTGTVTVRGPPGPSRVAPPGPTRSTHRHHAGTSAGCSVTRITPSRCPRPVDHQRCAAARHGPPPSSTTRWAMAARGAPGGPSTVGGGAAARTVATRRGSRATRGQPGRDASPSQRHHAQSASLDGACSTVSASAPVLSVAMAAPRSPCTVASAAGRGPTTASPARASSVHGGGVGTPSDGASPASGGTAPTTGGTSPATGGEGSGPAARRIAVAAGSSARASGPGSDPCRRRIASRAGSAGATAPTARTSATGERVIASRTAAPTRGTAQVSTGAAGRGTGRCAGAVGQGPSRSAATVTRAGEAAPGCLRSSRVVLPASSRSPASSRRPIRPSRPGRPIRPSRSGRPRRPTRRPARARDPPARSSVPFAEPSSCTRHRAGPDPRLRCSTRCVRETAGSVSRRCPGVRSGRSGPPSGPVARPTRSTPRWSGTATAPASGPATTARCHGARAARRTGSSGPGPTRARQPATHGSAPATWSGASARPSTVRGAASSAAPASTTRPARQSARVAPSGTSRSPTGSSVKRIP